MIRQQSPTNRPTHYKSRYKHDLSPREREVLTLIAKGRTNGEIANSLGLAFETVKWHVSGILGKLQVDSREEAAAYWRHYNSAGGRLTRGLHALIGLLTGKPAAIAGGALAATAAGAIALAAIWMGLSREDSDLPLIAEESPVPARVGNPVALAAAPSEASDVLLSPSSIWYQRQGEGVWRLDRATGSLTRVMAAPAAWQFPITSGGAVVWAMNANRTGAVGFDEATGAEVRAFRFTLPGPFVETWMAATETKLYVAIRHTNHVERYDIATGKADGTVEVELPKDLILAGGSLWTLVSREDAIDRIDPETMQVVARIPLPLKKLHNFCGSCLQQVFASEDSIWALSAAGEGTGTLYQVTRIDVATNEVLAVHEFEGRAGYTMAFDVLGDAWLGHRAPGSPHGDLVHISAATNEIVERIPLPMGKTMLETVTPVGVAVDGDDVWVFTAEGEMVSVRRTP